MVRKWNVKYVVKSCKEEENDADGTEECLGINKSTMVWD